MTIISKDKCSACAQYIPNSNGCHRIAHGMRCVLDEASSVVAAQAAGVKVSPPRAPALDVQVGGSHYKHFKIQPVEFITTNNLGFLEGCVIKRMCRWQNKAGVEDLRKAIHEIELLIEFEERKP